MVWITRGGLLFPPIGCVYVDTRRYILLCPTDYTAQFKRPIIHVSNTSFVSEAIHIIGNFAVLNQLLIQRNAIVEMLVHSTISIDCKTGSCDKMASHSFRQIDAQQKFTAIGRAASIHGLKHTSKCASDAFMKVYSSGIRGFDQLVVL